MNESNEQIITLTQTLTADVPMLGMTMKTIWHCVEYHDDGPVCFMVRELDDWRWCSVAYATPLEMTGAGGEEEIVYHVHRQMEGSVELWPEDDSNVVTLHRVLDGSMPIFEAGPDLDGVGAIQNDKSIRWRNSLRLLHERAI